jgi:phosphatidylglycerol:prolipoprotein diacylglycerol transferase
VFEHRGEGPFLSLLLSRGGLSWFGGLAGGLGCGLLYFRAKRYPIVDTLAAATPALAIGHLLGRIGCFLVGDDYGQPTNLPWGVAFPQGLPPTSVPVHPTQLYEAALLAVLAWLLFRWRRRGIAAADVLARYLLLAGTMRFAVEFLRIDTRVLAGLSVAHLAALAMIASGLLVWWRAPRAKS